jgi:hypothetical protein
MTILVRIGDPGDPTVALWERHPAHPGGEVFLAGPGEFEVAMTPAVEARLRNGRLVLVEPAIAPTVDEGAPEEAAVVEPAAPPRPRKSASARKGGL